MPGDEVEDALRKMATDDGVPAHLRLGALKQLVELRGSAPPPEQRPNGRATVESLPPDPLRQEWPDAVGEDGGRPLPPDPMADLDWTAVVGRAPHALYARVLVRVREAADKRALLDAEAWFLRSCAIDELAQRRRRRRGRK